MKIRPDATVVALFLVVAGLAASPASAAPSAPVGVSLTGCLIDGGSETVAAGVPISLQPSGYADGTHGLMVEFFKKEHTTLTIGRVGSTTTTDISATWSGPTQLDKHLWVTHPAPYDLGSLDPGTSLFVTEQITFTQPLLVAFPPVTQTGANGPFLVRAEPPLSCEIHAT
jgi:hypothetical protein